MKSTSIRQHMPMFLLLVITNVFVGSMVGLERTILPIMAEEDFGLASASAALSFIISFGFSKAIVNLLAGGLSDRFGRKRLLVTGWLFGLAVPILVIAADAWWMIVGANVLLGINQGLAWSMTVNMKIDLASPNERGTAVGLNEFAGYSGLAITAAASGYLASSYSVRPEPFYLGIAIAVTGLILSLFVKESGERHPVKASRSLWSVFKETTYQSKYLSSLSMAGLATNLKDGMAWGLFPLYFAAAGLSMERIGILIALYPAAWGLFQLFTGTLSDKIGRKWLIVGGMWTQSAALFLIIAVHEYELWIAGVVLLGTGTAMVYPVLQAALSDVVRVDWRASSMGVYRFWRDSGYAFGALFAGFFADALNMTWAIGLVALLPFLAGMNVLVNAKKLSRGTDR
ncbi:MFS transporter [Domibacillus enclensis]|uniref:MFS transporter n=1 Tax=Domibacillus enclensis TaxID=1017273 RepID=A0A1N6Z6U0_9BACI|nr:MFS transporter [Domibacillus enclensis]OXS76609.1 MFS transporter [Domibacillus enclensis]SIR22568.1 Predicted arabinose efflux permease, MFS family [Domibacillus enclensis]